MRWQPGDVVALRRLNAGRVSEPSAAPRLREEWADVAAG
jgi:hypothetical protein